MKIYFLRHATASDKARTDAERELTKEGEQEARVLGNSLAKLGAKPGRVFSSPLVRARQTAVIVAKVMKLPKKVELLNELKNESTTAALLRALKSCPDEPEILLVGHAPSFPEHIMTLIGAKKSAEIVLGKGGVACVELAALRAGQGKLQWLMRQKQLRLIAR
jgi:phosphohistidine phosphatase